MDATAYNDGYDNAFCQWLTGNPYAPSQPQNKVKRPTKPRLNRTARIPDDHVPLKCPHCPRTFRLKANLDNHILTKHDKKTVEMLKKHSYDFDKVPFPNISKKPAVKILVCARCPDIDLLRFADILRHNRTVHKFEENICACGLCDNRVFQTYKDLRDHVEKHHSNAYKPIQCTMCDYSCAKKTDMVKHYTAYHPHGEANFQCSFCNHNFLLEEEKVRHEADTHPMENSGYCQDCCMKFQSKEGLIFHIKTLHENYGNTDRKLDPTKAEHKPVSMGVVAREVPEKPGPITMPFKCLSVKEQKRHLKEVQRSPTEQCPKCDQSFTKRFALRRHYKYTHGDPDYMFPKEELAAPLEYDDDYPVVPPPIPPPAIQVSKPPTLVHYPPKPVQFNPVPNTVFPTDNYEPSTSIESTPKGPKMKQVFACPEVGCDYHHPHKSKIKKHVRDIHGKKKTKKIEASSQFVLQTDQQRKVKNFENMYPCSWFKCKKSFMSKEEVIEHVSVDHGSAITMEDLDNLPKLECDYCDLKFQFVKSKLKHIKQVHLPASPPRDQTVIESPPTPPQSALPLEPAVKIQQIERKPDRPLWTPEPEDLDEEALVPLSISPDDPVGLPDVKPEPVPSSPLPIPSFHCNQCKLSFSYHVSLNVHVKIEHQKAEKKKPEEPGIKTEPVDGDDPLALMNFPCNRCESHFDSKNALKNHEQAHHSKKGIKLKLIIKDTDWNYQQLTDGDFSNYAYNDDYYDFEEDKPLKKKKKTAKKRKVKKSAGLTEKKELPVWKKRRMEEREKKRKEDKGLEMKNNSNPTIFHCIRCEGFVPTKVYSKFAQHIYKEHGDDIYLLDNYATPEESGVEPVLECQECNQLFITKEQILDHALKTHSDIYRPARCPFCNLGFETFVGSVYHQKQFHLSEYEARTALKKTKALHCEECGKPFLSKGYLLIHVANVHTRDYAFKCTELGCEKAFPTPSRLKNHIEKWHDKKVNIKDLYPLKQFQKERKEVKKDAMKDAELLKGVEMKNNMNPMIFSCTRCIEFSPTNSISALGIHVSKYHADDMAKVQAADNVEEAGVEAVLQCMQCQAMFVTTNQFKDHVHAEHPDLYQLGRCQFCNLGFKTKTICIRHQKLNHPDEYDKLSQKKIKQAVSCQECGKVICNAASLMNHMKTIHWDKNDYKCPEDDCDKAYSTPYRLANHMMRTHNINSAPNANLLKKAKNAKKTDPETESETKKKEQEDKVQDNRELNIKFAALYRNFEEHVKKEGDFYYCTNEDCKYKCEKVGKLKCHIKNVHLRSRKYICEQCNKAFRYPAHLRAHVDEVHLNLRPFICDACGLTFTRDSNLKNHIRRSKGRCAKGKSSQMLSEKNLQHEAGSFMCDTCGNKFTDQESLNRHTMVNQGNCVFKCDHCDKIFLYKNSRNEHVQRVHFKSVDGFVCDLCAKSFTQKFRLTEHLAFEHGQIDLMPHSCRICGKRFVTETMYKKHMFEQHKKNVANFQVDIPIPVDA